MIQAALTVGSAEFWVLVILAVIVGGYLWYLERKTHASKADTLLSTYQTLTQEQIAALSDEELLPAVIANVMAKQDKKRPDPYFDLPLLSPERASVYRAWLVCREAETGNFAKLFASKTRLLTEAATEDFALIGANECSEALKTALAAEEGVPETAEESFATARQAEQPLSLLVDYIRDNAEAFAD